MAKGKVLAVIGAGFGSEGKGVVAHRVVDQYQYAVRTGAPNAGHSIVHQGKLYKMQTIPVAWTNKETMLIIGAGGLLNVDIFKKELEFISAVDSSILDRLVVDGACGILEQRHHHEEGGVDGELHKRMGSTGEGVGAARRDRMLRSADTFRLARACQELKDLGVKVAENTCELLYDEVKSGKNVMLEGTQGSGLSLIHGEWPHVTTSDTNAAALAADAGLPPHFVSDVVLVARTYPIRVAGPSGRLHNELSWEELSLRTGKRIVERTTVTNKIRRVGEWDENLFRKACALNGPTWVAITFMDYLAPETAGVTRPENLSEKALAFISYLERTFAVKVGLVGTGFNVETGWTAVEFPGVING